MLRHASMALALTFVTGCGKDRKKDEPTPVERVIARIEGKNVYGPIELPTQNWVGHVKSLSGKITPVSLSVMIPRSEDHRYGKTDLDKLAFYQLSVEGEEAADFAAIGQVSHVDKVDQRATDTFTALKDRIFIEAPFRSNAYSRERERDSNYGERFFTALDVIDPVLESDEEFENSAFVEFELVGEIAKRNGGNVLNGKVYLSYWPSEPDSTRKTILVGDLVLSQADKKESSFETVSDGESMTDIFRYWVEYDGDSMTYSWEIR